MLGKQFADRRVLRRDPASTMRRQAERNGRGLGPFTSGHLTIIVVTLLVAIAFPFAAFAVSGSNVFITDPSNGFHVRVDGQHQLETSIHDPSSGKSATIGSDGRIAATVGYPTRDIVDTKQGVQPSVCGQSDVCTLLLKPPAGKALVVTAIHVSVVVTPNPGAFMEIFRSSDGSCKRGTSLAYADEVILTARGMIPLEFPMPGGVPVPAGQALCVLTSDPGSIYDLVYAYGYAVATNAVPSP